MTKQRMLPVWVGVGLAGAGLAAASAGWAAATPAVAAEPAVRPATVPAAPTAVAASASAASAARVLPEIDDCPKELAVRQSVVADIPGWTSVSQQETYPFARIAFYSGPPANDKRIVPTYEYRNASGLHDGWRLQKQPAGMWMQCQYGNTTAVVIRKLDDANDACTADYDPRFSTLVVRHWACMPWHPPAAPPASRKEAPKARPAPSAPHWTHGQ